jgi:hypothetical protein
MTSPSSRITTILPAAFVVAVVVVFVVVASVFAKPTGTPILPIRTHNSINFRMDNSLKVELSTFCFQPEEKTNLCSLLFSGCWLKADRYFSALQTFSVSRLSPTGKKQIKPQPSD